MKKLGLIWENAKFSRIMFVLPFAYIGMFLAARGLPTLAQFVWITVAMASARTLTLSLNRVVDKELDSRHPVERFRPVPAGLLSVWEVLLVVFLCLILLLLSAWQLNELTLKLAPVAVVLLVGYNFTKYFTWACNFGVGLTQACGPVGAWIGVTGNLSWEAMVLGLIVFFWGNGFDLMQTCRDVDFDRSQKTHSFAVRFGVATTLLWSSIMHVVAFALLVVLGVMMTLSWPYWVGIIIGGGILFYEHLIVHPADLSRINFAWVDLNGYFSLIVMVFTFGALFI
ncbi:MAG: UbiA-like polyprenyltransferase [Dehalococcoidia bacterium]|nr:UbiA-like polyprenyltransferase [Dehalococcoidia bacterium]